MSETIFMTNTTALVTGAGTRVGRAMALRLAQCGVDVVVHYNSSAAPAEEVVELITKTGQRAVTVQADLNDEAQTAALIDKSADALGPINVLVNSASIFDLDRLDDMSAQNWARHQQINLRAPIKLVQDYAPSSPKGRQ